MKERIMVAFIEEVQRKGIKFTMDELAENLGVSKRTIYEHYSSKKDILDEIIIKSFHDIEEKEKIILDKQDISTIQKIKEVLIIVPTFFDLYDQQILDQMKKYYPEQWEKVMFGLNNTWNNLRSLLEKGVEEGVIKEFNFNIVMKLISNGTHWFFDQNYLIKHNINLTEAFTTVGEILLFGLVKEGLTP